MAPTFQDCWGDSIKILQLSCLACYLAESQSVLAAFVLILSHCHKTMARRFSSQPVRIISVFVGGSGEDWVACWGGACLIV